ncbi:MAG: hypothetical protein Q4G68_00520 [Planctomycetia bacterium]|nr:hypothetical protein [Planctomycetia bacterium]
MKNRISRTIVYCMIGLAVIIMGTVGCSQKKKATGLVQGKVTYNDAPLTNGTVVFQATNGEDQSSAELDASGVFVLPGAIMPGEYRVALLPVLRSDMDPDESKAAMDAFPIKGNYQIPEESPLQFTVVPGKNTAAFTIP